MDKPAANPPAQGSPESRTPDSQGLFGFLINTAIESALKCFLVLLLGGIAIDIAGDIWRDMTPSRPPGLPSGSVAKISSAWHAWKTPLDEHKFLIVFAIIFVPTAWGRLMGRGAREIAPRGSSRLSRARERFAEGWFSLIVVNAFGAMISATLVVMMQQVSLWKILAGTLLQPLLATLQSVVSHLLGTGGGYTLRAWLDWYGDNQLKFTFWVLYLAAICDDLGIPNFKTLGRWLWRRARRQISGRPALAPALGSGSGSRPGAGSSEAQTPGG